MTKWEYFEVQVIYASSENLDEVSSIIANGAPVFTDSKKPASLFVYFNQLGKEGWELVIGETNNKFYFKRPSESVR
jgi:hypothetical protein